MIFQIPASGEGDLTIRSGDFITMLGYFDPQKEWIYGELKDERGIFPAGFVRIIQDLPEDSVSETPQNVGQTNAQVSLCFLINISYLPLNYFHT